MSMEKPLHEGYLASDVEALKRSISNNLRYRSGKIPLTATRGDWLLAAELAVRNRLVERWMKSNTYRFCRSFASWQDWSLHCCSRCCVLTEKVFDGKVEALDAAVIVL